MSEPFAAVDVIATKRDRGRIPDEQLDWVIDAYTRGVVADEQMAALAMAILLNGMAPDELARWTAAMIASGERLDLSSVSRPTTDKHSTGGVGDKITLPLAPLVAACGGAVPQLSGRGLGHTGGTLDKLESIPGWRAQLSNAEFLAQLDDVGAVVCAAGDELAPADRKLYALRDVTATVESIPLIASSIMSKKIAEGSAALVLDVKVGSGAFMKTIDDARELARTMVELGAAHGTRTVALLTDMSTPLGRTAGNALEVAESVEVLAGGGPTRCRGADPGACPGDARRRRARGRGSGRRAAERQRDGRLAAHDQGSGRRSGCAATDSAGAARGVGAGRRRARTAGCPRGRRSGMAARRGTGAEGGSRLGECRRDHAREARRHRPRRRSATRALRRRRWSIRAGVDRNRGCVPDRRRLHGAALDHRTDRRSLTGPPREFRWTADSTGLRIPIRSCHARCAVARFASPRAQSAATRPSRRRSAACHRRRARRAGRLPTLTVDGCGGAGPLVPGSVRLGFARALSGDVRAHRCRHANR